MKNPTSAKIFTTIKFSPKEVLTYGCSLVGLLWVAAVSNWIKVSMDQLNCLFTGLGFVGLIATFRHESDQAEGDEIEHRETLRVMRLQAEGAKITGDATQNAALVGALAAKLQLLTAQHLQFCKSLKSAADGANSPYLAEIDRTQTELEYALSHLRQHAPA